MKKIGLLILASITFAFILGFIFKFGFLFNRFDITGNDLTRIKPGVFVSRKFNVAEIDKIKILVDDALHRNEMFWGKECLKINMIICYDRLECEHYSGIKRCGTSTQFTPLGTFITIGPEGRNVDVISHEICHSILENDLGFVLINRIPTWLNEGIAMQVDYRDDFVFPELEKIYIPDSVKLLEMSNSKRFYSNNSEKLRLNYAVAKLQVSMMIRSFRDINEFSNHIKSTKNIEYVQY